MDTFRERNTITSLGDLNEATAPDGFQLKNPMIIHCLITLYLIKKKKFRKIIESIKIDPDLYIQLQYNGIPVPLPR